MLGYVVARWYVAACHNIHACAKCYYSRITVLLWSSWVKASFKMLFRGALAFPRREAERAIDEHEIRCAAHIFVKAERQAVIQQEQHGAEALLAQDGTSISTKCAFGRKIKRYGV